MAASLEQAIAKAVVSAEAAAGGSKLIVVVHDGLPRESAALISIVTRRILASPSCAGVCLVHASRRLPAALPAVGPGGAVLRRVRCRPRCALSRDDTDLVLPPSAAEVRGCIEDVTAAAGAAAGARRRFSAVVVASCVTARMLAGSGSPRDVLAAVDPHPASHAPATADVAGLEGLLDAASRCGLALRVLEIDASLARTSHVEGTEGAADLIIRAHTRLEPAASGPSARGGGARAVQAAGSGMMTVGASVPQGGSWAEASARAPAGLITVELGDDGGSGGGSSDDSDSAGDDDDDEGMLV